MNIPFVSTGLFDINPNYKVSRQDNVLIVDDWYLNYEYLYNVLTMMPVARWKWEEGSRNFIDYYDCRILFPIHIFAISTQGQKIISNLLKEYFGESSNFKLSNHPAVFNFYKNINKGVSSSLQHHPHVDNGYNALVYLDKICSGGTALYDISPFKNNEQINLLYDITGISKNIISSKPNRLVIFEGSIMHGGYIQDHNKYVNDWRINQVMFFENE
jgi:hypothetical protein